MKNTRLNPAECESWLPALAFSFSAINAFVLLLAYLYHEIETARGHWHPVGNLDTDVAPVGLLNQLA